MSIVTTTRFNSLTFGFYPGGEFTPAQYQVWDVMSPDRKVECFTQKREAERYIQRNPRWQIWPACDYERGQYIDFIVKPPQAKFGGVQYGWLLMMPNKAGRQYLHSREGKTELDKHNSTINFLNLAEDQLCNGWDTIRPEEVAGLTDCLIISREAERNDYGDLAKLGSAYSSIRFYQIRSEVDCLIEDGYVYWEEAEDNSKPAIGFIPQPIEQLTLPVFPSQFAADEEWQYKKAMEAWS